MSTPLPRIMMISTHGYVAAEPELGKPDTGGQVVYVLELSKCLARLGYQVDILTRQFEGQPAEEFVAEQVRLLRFPCGGNDFIPKETLCNAIPEWVDAVDAYVRENELEYQLINSHYWDAGLAGVELAQRCGVAHFHTPHSIGAWKRDNMDGEPEVLERRYNFRRRVHDERQIYQACTRLIATTPTQRAILQGPDYEIPPDKIQVIPPGYDDRRFFQVGDATRHALKQDLKLDGRVVLALGRLARNKGYDLLIEAMVPVVERFPDARLVLAVGSTEPSEDERQQLARLRQRAAELGLADQVDFRDYVPDEQLADYYRAADVFALSSRYEPFGMTAVEAMACGTPTVITTEGGLWQQVTWGWEALYANPFDPPAFGHMIASVFQHPEVAQQLANGGAHKARARFTWTGIAQQLVRALDPQVETATEAVCATVQTAAGLALETSSRLSDPHEQVPPLAALAFGPTPVAVDEERQWQAKACL